MRVLFLNLVLLSSIISVSCSNNQQVNDKPIVKGKMLVELPVAPERVAGTYIGEFKGSPILINLQYISGSHASGYNVHKGLKRNVSGSVEFKDGKLHMHLAEPGNNQYDGKFDLVIDTTSWKGSGNWVPMKKGEKVSFSFEKKNTNNDYDDPFNAIYIDEKQNYVTLNPDGTCSYSYLTDTTKTGQLITIRGSYSVNKDSSIAVFWQPNDLYSSRKSTFKIITTKPNKEEDWVERKLKGEGKEFTQLLY